MRILRHQLLAIVGVALPLLLLCTAAEAQDPRQIQFGDSPFPFIAIGEEATIVGIGDPSGGSYSWTSEDESIVEILSGENTSEPEIRGLKLGSPNLTVRYTAPSGTTAEQVIKVRVISKDHVAIGWVDRNNLGTPPATPSVDATLIKLAFENANNESGPISLRLPCAGMLGSWTTGFPAFLAGDGAVDNANYHLLFYSENGEPPNEIDRTAELNARDFRLFARLQVYKDDNSGSPQIHPFMNPVAATGPTPNPCNIPPSEVGGADHPLNGAVWDPASDDTAFLLAQGRLSALGQLANRTINFPEIPQHQFSQSTPWIWSFLEIDSETGELLGFTANSEISRFPTFYRYENNQLVEQVHQTPDEFIPLNSDYQFDCNGRIPGCP